MKKIYLFDEHETDERVSFIKHKKTCKCDFTSKEIEENGNCVSTNDAPTCIKCGKDWEANIQTNIGYVFENHINRQNVEALMQTIEFCIESDKEIPLQKIIQNFNKFRSKNKAITIASTAKYWYERWIPLALNVLEKYEEKDFNSVFAKLYNVGYTSGCAIYDLSGKYDDLIDQQTHEEITEAKYKEEITKNQEQSLNHIIKVFMHVVWFCDVIGLDPLSVLNKSTKNCGMEEYGAVELLHDYINCMPIADILNMGTVEHAQFIKLLYGVWGSFNIFYTLSHLGTPENFNNKIVEVSNHFQNKQIKT